MAQVEEKDQRVVDELFEEELDRRLREDDEFHRISDELMDEIELRFLLLADGTVAQQARLAAVLVLGNGRPRDFIRTVTRFSSQPRSTVRPSSDAVAGEWRSGCRRIHAAIERRGAAQAGTA